MGDTAKDKSEEFSLLHAMAMGGIHGGDGFTFQERYIVCHIAKWINDPNFIRLMNEGTGDVDVAYKDGEGLAYEHIQVKDHKVTPSEFKEVLEGFAKIDAGMGKTYRRFILTSPSVSDTIESLGQALLRYRQAKLLYDEKDHDTVLRTTKDDLLKKINEIGLSEYTDFILEKLDFEIGRFDFSDNGTCRKMFISTLVEHPKYKDHIHALLKPVYASLIEQVSAHRGKVLDLATIEGLITEALTRPNSVAAGTILDFHNWDVVKFDTTATEVIDWSHLFVRESRSVPDAKIWNEQLIPQLVTTKKKIASTAVNRHIVFRGKCTLSSAIALGMVFPEVGNWSFEISQPPQIVPWRSDADKSKDYKLTVSEINPSTSLDKDCDDVAIVFNITGRAVEDVGGHLLASATAVKAIISIGPDSAPGNSSIENDSEAVSLAGAAKDAIKQMINKYKAKKVHLFYFGPSALAVFLGQKLTSVGQVQLYEYQDPGYKASCLLKS